MTTISLKVRRFAMPFQCCLIGVALMSGQAPRALAQDAHSHPSTQQESEMTLEQQSNAQTLLKTVRTATERYKDVKVAEAEGYALQFGCVTGDDAGAMGLHYVNGTLVNSGVLDATRPQIIIYEPMPDGSLKLIGADF